MFYFLGNRVKPMIEIFLFGILPILVVFLLGINFESSHLIIIPYVLVVLARFGYLLHLKKISFREAGFVSLKNGYKWYLAVTVIFITGLYFYRNFIVLPPWLAESDPILVLIIHALVQEIIFRSYLLQKIRLVIPNEFLVAIFCGILFSFFHIVMIEPFVVMVLTFFAGTIWSYIFLKFPNIYLVTMSHFLVNFSLGMMF